MHLKSARRHATALVVEEQPFVAAFVRDVLEAAGQMVSVAPRSASNRALGRSPATIVLGVHGFRRRPLEAIRRARKACADARIVAIAERDDVTWTALALALGADAVVSLAADRTALGAALVPPNASGKRTVLCAERPKSDKPSVTIAGRRISPFG